MLPEDTAPSSTAPPTLSQGFITGVKQTAKQGRPADRSGSPVRVHDAIVGLIAFSSAACSLGQIPEHGVIEGGRAGSDWGLTDTTANPAEASGTDANDGSQDATDHSQATSDASMAEDASGGHDMGQETGELDSMDPDQTQAESSGPAGTSAEGSGNELGSDGDGGTATGNTATSDETLDSSADSEDTRGPEGDAEATETDTGETADTEDTESTGDSDPPTLEPLDCSLEDNLSSEWGGGGTKYPETIYFKNESGATRRLYWLDGNGKRDFYASLKAGSARKQEARTSDVWLVTDNDRNCVEIFVGLVGESQALLR